MHGAAAGFIHNGRDLRRVGRHHHRAEAGVLRAAQNMHDHRLSADIGERLARQPGCGHAGWNEDKNISHRVHRTNRAYTGCKNARQTG